MSRTVKEIQLDQPLDVVSMIMDDFIYHNHFLRTDWQGEMVFYSEDSHRGVRYFKWSYAGGLFRAEAWVKGPMGGEDSLNGIYQGATKRQFAADLERLCERLRSATGSNMSGGHIGSDPIHHGDGGYSNHENWAQDTYWQQDSYTQSDSSSVQSTWQQNEENEMPAPDFSFDGMNDSRNTGYHDPKVMQLCLMAILFGLFIPMAGLIIAIVAKTKAKGTATEHVANNLVKIAFIIIFIRFLISFITPFIGFILSGVFS